jgi:hypothetical protein
VPTASRVDHKHKGQAIGPFSLALAVVPGQQAARSAQFFGTSPFLEKTMQLTISKSVISRVTQTYAEELKFLKNYGISFDAKNDIQPFTAAHAEIKDLGSYWDIYIDDELPIKQTQAIGRLLRTAFPLLAALKNVGELFVNDCVEISAWLEEGKK